MIAGVDGCKSGWIVAIGEGWPCALAPEILVAAKFSNVLTATAQCAIVVIDIPIGLPNDGAGRGCDALARQRLGPSGQSRVFPAPPRGALCAGSPTAFQKIHRQITGKGASLPVWGIVPKLREVDAALTPALQRRVMEFHPELAWARLAGRALASKHTALGLDQRHAVLALYVPDLPTIVRCRSRLGSGVGIDDLFDALVGLMVAQGIQDGIQPANRLPVAEVPLDERGLKMEIWY